MSLLKKCAMGWLNKVMNYSSLGEICSEVINESMGIQGLKSPQETRDSLNYKTNRIGHSTINSYEQSINSGQNPYEQEEVKTVDQGKVIDILNNYISHVDNSDQSGILITKILKSLINKIKSL